MRNAWRSLLAALLCLLLLAGCAAPEAENAAATPEPEGMEFSGGSVLRDESIRSLLICAVSYDRDGYSLLTSLHVLVRNADGEIDLITIPKDTRVLMQHYGEDGAAYTGYGPISDVYHAAEDAGLAEQSTVDAVSALLGGVRIDRYAFLNVVQLQDLADLLEGEIYIDVEDDVSDLNVYRGYQDVRPVLAGFASYSYLNDIGGIDYPGTDPYKLRRHQQLIEAFLSDFSGQMEALSQQEQEALAQDIVDCLRTDLTAQDVQSWTGQVRRLHTAQILEGYENETDQDSYWIPDRSALKTWVIEHFYCGQDEEE